VDCPPDERIVASRLPARYKRVAMYRQVVSGNSIRVSYAMSFLLFVLLVALAVVLLVLLVYLLVRRWL
jgi:hypothetical protein